jgi:hypothetical protein
MNKTRLGLASLSVIGIAVVGLTAVAATDKGEAQAAGLRVDNFRLTSHDRQSYELYRMKDAAAVVIVTQADGCKPLRAQAANLKKLRDAYAGKNVEFVMLNSKLGDTPEAIVAEAQAAGYGMPILLDAQQLAGEQLKVTRAGEVIVVDPKTWRVAWRGGIDAKANAAAVEAVVSGSAPPSSKAVRGACTVDFPDRAKAAEFAKISYAKEIAPIIRGKCIECHQPGGIGPMEFTTYDKIKTFSPMIREVVRTRRMPPWHADPNVNKFHDDSSLTPAEMRTLVHWVEAGAPRGEGIDPLATVKFEAPEWPLGKPDLILDIPAYTVPASGTVQYQRPWTANPSAEGKWLRASSYKIGQRKAVHHILSGYMTSPPEAGKPAAESRWGTSLGTFAVGTNPTVLPSDTGAYIPPGGAIGFQNHYTPFGKEVVDKSQIALYFYKEQPKMVMRTMVIADPTITIPPNTERHREIGYLTFPNEAILYGAFIHAHYRGSGSDLTIIYPDGTRKLLISVPKYDFNWQRDYDFAEPVKVPAGAKIVATYTYDNSKRNPANPDPNRTVPWGDQSWDEMFYTALRYRWTDETSTNKVNHDAALGVGRTIGMLDDNLNGTVEMAELKGGTGTMIKGRFAMLDVNKDGVLQEAELAPLATALRRAAE